MFNRVEVSGISFRKSLVARRLCTNLNWNSISLVLLVHRDVKRYAELQSRFSFIE